MKKFLPFSLLLLVTASFTACKKDKDPSRSELIVGSWNIVAGGVDENNNTILDSNEREDLPADVEVIYTFKSGGAGVAVLKQTGSTSGTQTQSFDWKFINEDKVLEFSLGQQGASNLNVTLLTGQQFEGNNISGSTRNFQIWKKQ